MTNGLTGLEGDLGYRVTKQDFQLILEVRFTKDNTWKEGHSMHGCEPHDFNSQLKVLSLNFSQIFRSIPQILFTWPTVSPLIKSNLTSQMIQYAMLTWRNVNFDHKAWYILTWEYCTSRTTSTLLVLTVGITKVCQFRKSASNIRGKLNFGAPTFFETLARLSK